MTRLSEALERAEANKGATTTTTPAAEPLRDVPSDWKFQEIEMRPAPESPEPPPEPKPVAPQARPALAAPPARTTSATPQPPPASTAREALTTSPSTGLSAETAAKLVIGQRDNLLVEQFRRLAAVLHHSQQQRHTKTAMIASAVPAEGKSLTATNLALTLSRSYDKRVLLIDADLRRPTLHTLFNVSNAVGLRTSLTDPKHARLPVIQVDDKLWLLSAGRPDPNPTSLVTSPAMKQLITDATEEFDWVIIDTPPVGLMADANLLAAMVEVAFVVVNAGQTPYPLVKKAVEAIGIERVLGVVLNRADRGTASDAYSYGDYYSDEARNAAPGRKRFALG